MTEITETTQNVSKENKKKKENKESNMSIQSIYFNIDLVKYPVITEKTYLSLYKNSQYTFDVDKRLTKTQIKKLFTSLFSVEVIDVNTHIPPRQRLRVGMSQGYRPSFKRAIITLKKGQSINYNLQNQNEKDKKEEK